VISPSNLLRAKRAACGRCRIKARRTDGLAQRTHAFSLLHRTAAAPQDIIGGIWRHNQGRSNHAHTVQKCRTRTAAALSGALRYRTRTLSASSFIEEATAAAASGRGAGDILPLKTHSEKPPPAHIFCGAKQRNGRK
jgi:hypothetical protein